MKQVIKTETFKVEEESLSVDTFEHEEARNMQDYKLILFSTIYLENILLIKNI